MARSNLALVSDDELCMTQEPEANPTLTTPTTAYDKRGWNFLQFSDALSQSDPFALVVGTVTGKSSWYEKTRATVQNIDAIVCPTYPENVGLIWGGTQRVGMAYTPEPQENIVKLLSEIGNSMLITFTMGKAARVAEVVRPTANARVQLLGLHDLPAHWNEDSPVPNMMSIGLGMRILNALDEAVVAPDRVVPDAEGGVSIYFFGTKTLPGGAHQRYASISASNEGDIVALVHDRDHDPPEAWSVGEDRAAIGEAVERIRRFTTA